MMISETDLRLMLNEWMEAWNAHDLDRVMRLFDDEVIFENWTGARVQGKEKLRRAWTKWFARGDFRFFEEETFISETEQKVLFRWRLEWPSPEKGFEGLPEVRRGVDVLHFTNGRISCKLTYTKSKITIDNQLHSLKP